MSGLIHTVAGLGSSSLIAHVLHSPPPPPANNFVIGPAVINTHTVRGSRNYFVCQNWGGSEYKFLEFFQHSVSGLSLLSLSSLSHTLCPVPYTSLSLSLYLSFSLPRSLRLTPSSLSLRLNPEIAPGIRKDLTFLRARFARPESAAPGARPEPAET